MRTLIDSSAKMLRITRNASRVARNAPRVTRHASRVTWPVLLLGLVTCDADRVTSARNAIGDSRAFNLWAPATGDSCTPEVHNRYFTVGPDGLRYPTWHPPTDPSGCSFGHEHGRDPRGSDLYEDVGALPFGYANQQLEIYDPANPRNEDHVGHKVEWENDVRLDFNGGLGGVLEVTCDVLAKLHQGTHSKDAFTNNVHEIIYHIRCNDRTEMHIIMLTAIGTPGEFTASCDRERHVVVGPATPRNSPEGGGHRAIPDRLCVEQHMLVPVGQRSNFESALRESWETSNSIKTAEGRTVASFDPYFQVIFPSRFYDATKTDGVGRPIEVCYEVTATGARAQGGECRESTSNGTVTGLTYNDPRSAFNGVLRFMDVNGNRVSNQNGPEVWYTDPYGKHARTSPFPGSIRQWIAKIDNTGRPGHGPVVGRQRNYGGTGVHAPN
jgi:hypothetical protein